MMVIIPSGEASCGNSTEIFTTETPSSMCNEVSDGMVVVIMIIIKIVMITKFVIIIKTVLQGSFHLTKGWEQLLHLCDKRQFGKGGRRGEHLSFHLFSNFSNQNIIPYFFSSSNFKVSVSTADFQVTWKFTCGSCDLKWK